ncbi:hypothetical protein LN042_16220 [Kitasatospora sp. RB6PN24]|uniref:hypothetical protein n=1 Tax=Kitasatospora humi TaxID=2893891 RepID=UPI001E45088C|nr:hypothetical protein [Kitasatospora humi]MCC9308612.1 hypothetical protein [Kitasatospora humi]
MGLMDRIKEMFGGEHGEKAGQRPDTAERQVPGRDSQQYQSGQSGAYSSDAFGGVSGKAGQPDEQQLHQAESDMESEGGHEWEK